MFNEGWIGNYSYFRARINPDSTAVHDLDTDTRFTYAELDKRADRLAFFLKDDAGIRKNDRVAFLSRNRIEMIDGYYATAKTASILVPYNYRLSASEIEQLADEETPSVLFYEKCFENLVSGLKGKSYLRSMVVLDDPDSEYTEKTLTYSKAVEGRSGTVWNSESGMEDIHLIIHTGGTTGLPKGGMISHRSMLFNSMNEICTWGISHTDKAHILLPLFHTGGWNLLTLPILHAGGTIILNRQFEPGLALRVISLHKPTFVFGAATIFRMMAADPGFESADFSSVKWIMAGAAPTPLNVMEKYWNRGVPFVLGYGMTEAGPNNLTAPAEFMSNDEMKAKYASVGRPMYFTLARIVDDEGNDLGYNEPGELIWSGPQIFSGYWNRPEETSATLKNGWVHTGDVAVRDEDGYYYIVGRKKNMYISGGENVFPPEIESELYRIEEINEVCVIGVPDEKWGEVGKAVISFKPGRFISAADILSTLRTRLAAYKVPKFLAFVDDIPKNNVGKIVASKVSELYGRPVSEDRRSE